MTQQNQFDLSFGVFDFHWQTTYTQKWCNIPKSSHLYLKEFSFLKDLRAPKGWYYLYFIWNKKSGVIKLGQSSKPINRIKQHIRNFVCYGNNELEDIGCLFSRNPFPCHVKAEEEFITYCKKKCPNIKIEGKEFFHTLRFSEFKKIRSAAKSFLESHPENV